MSYEPLPIVEVKVRDLRLDMANYRIAASQPSEAAAMNYLYLEHDVYEVASLILREGYFDIEIPLAVEEDGHYVVLEGNRRVTALRSLLDPSLVPAHQGELERLLKKYEIEARALPEKIRVMMVADRAVADKHLARLHVGRSKRAWSVDDQARFLIAQLDGGASLEDVRRDLPGIKNPLTLVRHYRVREMLKSTPFADPAIARFAAGQSLKMTAFEYAYGNPEVQGVIGLAFDKNGNLTAGPHTPDQLRALERLVGMYKANELNTRTFPKKTSPGFRRQMDALLARLRGDQEQTRTDTPVWVSPDSGPTGNPQATPRPPAVAQGAGSTTSTLVSPEPPTSAPALAPDMPASAGGELPQTAPTRRGPDNPDTKNALVVTVDFSRTSVGLQKRFIELRGLRITQFPASTAMLMRLVIESTIKAHFMARGRHDVSGMLGDVLPALVSEYGEVPAVRRPIAILDRGRGQKGRAGSKDWFNTLSHNPAAVVNPQEVREAWQELESLVDFLLAPPTPQPVS